MAILLTAMFMSVLFIASSFSIDLGGRAQQKRNDHLIADMAALDAIRGVQTSGLAVAQDAQASAVRNGWFTNSAEYLQVVRGTWSLVSGSYTFSPANLTFTVTGSNVTPSGADNACGSTCNAVQVTAYSPYQDLFQAQNGAVTLSAESTVAMVTPPTCCSYPNVGKGQFQIGSYLVNVTVSNPQYALFGDLLKPMLNNLSSNLTLVGYQGLANTNTTLGLLGQALGFSGTALTPSTLLASQVSVQQLLNAEMTLLGNGTSSSCSSGTASAACSSYQLGLLGTTLAGSALFKQTFTLSSFLGMQNVSVGNGSVLDTTVNLLQAFNGAVAIADGTNAIATSVGVSALGAHVTTSLSVIAPPTISGYTTVAAAVPTTNVQVAFASTATYSTTVLGVTISASLSVTGTVGNATATLTAVDCPATGPDPTDIKTGPVTFNNIAGPNGTGAATVTGTASGTIVLTGLSAGASAALSGSLSQVSTDPATSHTLVYDPPPTNFANTNGTPVAVNGNLGATTLTLGQSGATLNLLTSLLGGGVTNISSALQSGLTTDATTGLGALLTPLGITIGNADLLGIHAACPVPTIVG